MVWYVGHSVADEEKIMSDFATQGRVYIDRLKTRNRRPIRAATVAAFEGYLRNHVVPSIGTTELESFKNGALKTFVQTLVDKKLSPKTIAEISAFTRSIVASVLDADGNQVYPRTWNQDFVDAPPIVRQHQPVCTKEMIKEALRVRHVRTDKHRVLIALLLASGIRVGELVALRVGDDGERSGWDQGNSLLAIRTSLWRGKEQKPKTQASIRMVDLSAPVNDMLAAHVVGANKKPGDYLFSSRAGRPLSPGSLRRKALDPLGISGFHSCRRWRVSYLKTVGTPDSLLRAWIGHSHGNQSCEKGTWGNDTTAIYDKSAEDKEWRRAVVNSVGIGFELPELCPGPPAPRIVSAGFSASTAQDALTEPVATESATTTAAEKPAEPAAYAKPYIPTYIGSDDDLPAMLFEESR
jgi:integrase